MNLLVQPSDLVRMKDRLSEIPSGDYALTSIGVKNYLMWAGGNWEEKYDYAMHDFFANAKRDISMLIADCERLLALKQEYEQELARKDECIQKIRLELKTLKEQIEDDGR